jgi:HD containing hydrolase-like enzyme
MVENIMYKSINMTRFPKEREEKLKAINRYSYFEVMFYRSNDLEHSQRVLWLLEALVPLAQKYLTFDVEKARALALVHDDVEIIKGDMPSHKKALMSEEEKAVMMLGEEDAISYLAGKYPSEVNGYSYKELLTHASKKDCIEAELVAYADKLDAQCESFHEVLAGNIMFLRSVCYYAHVLVTFGSKFPRLKDFLADKTSPLTYVGEISNQAPIDTYKALLKPYDKESILLESDFPLYNAWKNIVIEQGGEAGLSWMVEQREFIK